MMRWQKAKRSAKQISHWKFEPPFLFLAQTDGGWRVKDWGDSKSDFLSFTRPDTAPPLHCPNLHVFEMRERAKLFSSIAMSHCDCDTSNQFMAVADLNVTPAQIVTVMKPSSANTCSSLSCEKCSITVICGSHACNAMWETQLEIKASAGVRIQGLKGWKHAFLPVAQINSFLNCHSGQGKAQDPSLVNLYEASDSQTQPRRRKKCLRQKKFRQNPGKM